MPDQKNLSCGLSEETKTITNKIFDIFNIKILEIKMFKIEIFAIKI
jgi:hypothetical protein